MILISRGLYTGSRNTYPSGSKRKEIEEKFRDITCEKPRLGPSVSFVGNKNIPFLRIYRYKEAFAFSLVKDLLRKFKADPSDYVFDPFSGSGTTMFTSMTQSIPSIGIDKLPTAHFISKTLLSLFLLKENELKEIWTPLIPRIEKSKPSDIASDVPIMKAAFDEETLLLLRRLKSTLDNSPASYCDIFLLLFFSILEECSFTSKDGQFLRLKQNKKTSNPIEAMSKKVTQVEKDIRRAKVLFPRLSINKETIPDVYLGDTRELSGIEFRKKPTIIITSPPYVNRYDYTRTYCLELCFHFVKSSEELKAVRFGLLRSHIESKIQKGEAPPHPAIEEVVKAFTEKKLNNPKIPDMITAYFIDMQKVVREWFKVLAPGAKVAVVINNVRFEGELIPVDLILSEMAEKAGFEVKEIIVARYKGNSSQQIERYGKVPVRESIVIWERP